MYIGILNADGLEESQGRHTIDRTEEKGVERESARRSLKGRKRAIVNQTNIGTV